MSLPTHRPTLRELCAPAFCVLCVGFFLGLRSFHPFQKQSAKQQELTLFFSMAPFHFFGLFFTLAEISPVLATYTKKTRGAPSLRHKMCTMVISPDFLCALCLPRPCRDGSVAILPVGCRRLAPDAIIHLYERHGPCPPPNRPISPLSLGDLWHCVTHGLKNAKTIKPARTVLVTCRRCIWHAKAS